MEEHGKLLKLQRNCEEWNCRACALLQDATTVMNFDILFPGVTDTFALKADTLRAKMALAIHDGVLLGFDLEGVVQLGEACSSLRWCTEAICLHSLPSEEVIYILASIGCLFI